MPVEPLLRAEAIAARIPELAREIAAALPGPELRMIGPLKGCVLVMADLSRALHAEGVRVDMDFLRLASYGAGTDSSGVVRLERELIHDPAGKHVLLVDDIVDTGRTLAFAQAHLREKGVASLRTAVLMDKPARRVVQVPVEHVGFVIPDAFVVGFGCDYAEAYRELPYVGVLRR